MSSPFRKYLSVLRGFPILAIRSPEKYFVEPLRDFTRERNLSLPRLPWLVIGLLRKSLSVELSDFFERLAFPVEQSVTKSAFVQARAKLLPLFFRDLFQLSADAFYQNIPVLRWRGYRLWATDGSGFRLPDVLELGEDFGWHGNQHNRVPSSRMLIAFDLLNKTFTQISFHTRHVAELVMATNWIADIPKDVVMVYDRGFASHLIPFLHQHFGTHCIIRMPVGQSKTIKEFVASGKNQAIITEKLQSKARKSLNALGIETPISQTITYRLLRYALKTGEVEVILTTLLDKKKFPRRLFGPVYGKRWGVETAFFVVKSYLKLCIFSAHRSLRCIQDLFATFTFYNIQSASAHEFEPKLQEINRTRKHDYQMNRNVGAGLLKRFLPKFLILPEEDVPRALAEYSKLMLQSVEPIRKNKNRVRKRRLMRGTERHVHEKNYRPAL